MAVYIGSLVKHFANYYKCRPENYFLPFPTQPFTTALIHIQASADGITTQCQYTHQNLAYKTLEIWLHGTCSTIIKFVYMYISASCIYLRVCQKPYWGMQMTQIGKSHTFIAFNATTTTISPPQLINGDDFMFASHHQKAFISYQGTRKHDCRTLCLSSYQPYCF